MIQVSLYYYYSSASLPRILSLSAHIPHTSLRSCHLRPPCILLPLIIFSRHLFWCTWSIIFQLLLPPRIPMKFPFRIESVFWENWEAIFHLTRCISVPPDKLNDTISSIFLLNLFSIEVSYWRRYNYILIPTILGRREYPSCSHRFSLLWKVSWC